LNTFNVIGSHTYPASPNGQTVYTVTISLVRSASNQPASLMTPATVYSFLGQLSPTSATSAPFATNLPQPTFIGTAQPGSVVNLSATKSGVPTSMDLGQVIVTPNGQWSLKVLPPLADGTYVVTGTVTPPGGSPSQPMFVTPGGGLVVDSVAPRVVALSSVPRHNQVIVVVRDDRSGMNLTKLGQNTNYYYIKPGTGAVAPTSAAVSMPQAPTDPVIVTLTFPRTVRVRGNLRGFHIRTTGIQDNAGNPLLSVLPRRHAVHFWR
jgi:hypothetical protein